MTTCSDHRNGLVLLTLRRRLAEEALDDEERREIEAEADRLEEELDLN